MTSVKLLDSTVINALALSDADKKYLKNINDFVAWYADKYNKPLPSVTSSAQVERTDKIKNHILSGLAAGGVLTFPNVIGEVTDVRISVPSQYTLSINGYQTRQLSATEYQVLVSGTQPQLTLQYQLGVASPQSFPQLLLQQAKKLT
ncbi:hypothetical protein [Streptococcus gallinaceus]|uniref:hypothetical protein n=1 Tax=Streptococcus gallinaceus TaxID=165758 RepID=UPI0020A3CD2C|nr:hypothetical protein [Streptococcus gallinaceus]MCP1770163.1 hypothetical protein [Streptococcus gallinaceus]